MVDRSGIAEPKDPAIRLLNDVHGVGARADPRVHITDQRIVVFAQKLLELLVPVV
jgi:hypothetical protein